MERSCTVLASRIGVEERQLIAALAARSVAYRQVDTRAMAMTMDDRHGAGQVVLNREIGYTRAVYAARVLESAGATVVNTAAATEVCGDKWRTTAALYEAGLPVPKTALALTPEAALTALDEIGYPAVLKPLVGSWGRLVTFLPDRHTATAVLEHVAALPSPQAHVVYVQEFVPAPDRDLRLVVVAGDVLGAVYRVRAGWRTNVARGAVSEPCELTPDRVKLAAAAVAAVGAEIAGVDLIEDDAGVVRVLEVNHRVEFAGFQRALGDQVDVAGRIVDHLLTRAAS